MKGLVLGFLIVIYSFSSLAGNNGSEISGKVKNLVISEESISFNLDASKDGYSIRTHRCNQAQELTFVIYFHNGFFQEMLASFVLAAYNKDEKIVVIGNGDCYIDKDYQQETIKQITESL